MRRGSPNGPAGPNGGVELSWAPPGGQAEEIPASAYRMNDDITCLSPPPGDPTMSAPAWNLLFVHKWLQR